MTKKLYIFDISDDFQLFVVSSLSKHDVFKIYHDNINHKACDIDNPDFIIIDEIIKFQREKF